MSGFGIEASQAAQYVIAFVIILVLVALFGLVLRRLTGGRLMLPGQDRGRARQPRLGIVDIYDLDRQRQLILLRRDNVEHLLLIGGPNDVVIETNIVRVAGARLPSAPTDTAAERAEPTFDRAPEAARPQIEPGGRPTIEAQLAARLGSFAGRSGDGKGDADQENGSTPARVEPVLKPSAVTLATPPAPPPASPPPPAPTPLPQRAPLGARSESSAPPVRPVSPVTQTRTPSEPPVRPVPRPEPRPVSPPPVPPAPPSPPPVRPTPPERNADAAVLSDMAKQLEEALRRPQAASAPTPNRVLPALDNPRRDDEDLIVPPQRPAPRPEPVRPEPVRLEPARPEPIRPEPPRPEPAPRPEPVRAEPLRPEPSRPTPVPPPAPPRSAPPPPPPAPPRAAPPPPPASPPSQQARPVDDPFSVDEIEAEFARLLGRPNGSNGKT